VPQNAREWDVFIRQYENCIEYLEGRGFDFTFEGMTNVERLELIDKHMYLGKGFKKSVFECFYDGLSNETEIFAGVNWHAVSLVNRVWMRENIFVSDEIIKMPAYVMGLVKLESRTSLAGSPKHVMGDFICSSNMLTSLEGAPEFVGGGFKCNHSNLKNLTGAPKRVEGAFDCSHNELTSLECAPEHVGRYFVCNNNRLESLKGAPRHVDGKFDCSNNRLTSLEGAPKYVGGYFNCGWNKLPSSVPSKILGSDIHKYIGLKESFVMGWKEFNANK
jgi:hypothetical protein